MKLIFLSRGKFAQVDDKDYERVNRCKWYCNSNGYAVRDILVGWEYPDKPKVDSKNKRIKKHIYMHHFILNVSDSIRIDHEDLNKLNYQKYNLRVATHQQNSYNRGPQANNTSGYKGVGYDDRSNHCNKPWYAQIYHNGKTIFLGYYATNREAGIVYNKKAKELFGEFAWLNSI